MRDESARWTRASIPAAVAVAGPDCDVSDDRALGLFPGATEERGGASTAASAIWRIEGVVKVKRRECCTRRNKVPRFGRRDTLCRRVSIHGSTLRTCAPELAANVRTHSFSNASSSDQFRLARTPHRVSALRSLVLSFAFVPRSRGSSFRRRRAASARPRRTWWSTMRGYSPRMLFDRINRLIFDVKAKSGGEIVVVTLPDIAGRDVGDIALRIGRDWKVGANAAIGDRARNAGVVVLVVPKETSSDGRGHVSIMTGQGVEGFITDGTAGDIRREAITYFQRGDYSGALEMATQRLAQRFGQEFNFTVDSGLVDARYLPTTSLQQPGRGFPPQSFLVAFILLLLFSPRWRAPHEEAAAADACTRSSRTALSREDVIAGTGGRRVWWRELGWGRRLWRVWRWWGFQRRWFQRELVTMAKMTLNDLIAQLKAIYGSELVGVTLYWISRPRRTHREVFRPECARGGRAHNDGSPPQGIAGRPGVARSGESPASDDEPLGVDGERGHFPDRVRGHSARITRCSKAHCRSLASPWRNRICGCSSSTRR